MRKKVVLYNPKAVFYDMPLALLAIGSALDLSRYEVIIIDGRTEPDIHALLARHLPEALCFGVTVITGAPLQDALDVSRKVKKWFPYLPVIWGGWHASLFPENILSDETCVDITVRGQGELTFRELVQHIDERTDICNIQGICYRDDDGHIITNPARPLVPAETLDRVDYSLIDVEQYFRKKGRRQFDMVTSTGCLFRCAFCADPMVYGRKFTALPALRMAGDLAFYYDRFAFTDLNFQDETFFTDSGRVRAFAGEVIQRKMVFSWAATMRADQGARFDMETWRLIRNSGLRRLMIGVESGSQEMMDTLSKDIKYEDVFACAKTCKQLGISAIFPFIIGFPGESDNSVKATARMMKDLSAMSPLFETPLFHFRPYPGSQIALNVEAADYKLPDTTESWAGFDYVGTTGPWVSQQKERYFSRLKFYLKIAYGRPRILLLPLRPFARWRCRHDRFGFPLAKVIIEFLRPQHELS